MTLAEVARRLERLRGDSDVAATMSIHTFARGWVATVQLPIERGRVTIIDLARLMRGTAGLVYAVHNGSVTALTPDEFLALDVEAAEAAGARFRLTTTGAAIEAATQQNRTKGPTT